MNALPGRFARTMVELYGEAGTEWLRRLPNLLADCARRWSLALQPALPNLTYNYVPPAVRADGTQVILKLDRILARRVDQFADELGLDRRRLLRWGIVQAVLSAWWSVEDQGYGWEPALAVAETLARL